MTPGRPTYWRARFLTERALALIYLVAFLVAANQFLPLLGERGLLPVPTFVRAVPFDAAPSLFYFAPTNTTFLTASWVGVLLSLVALSPYPARNAIGTSMVWGALWLLYLSFVNVGQAFYAFGWELLLLEAGFLAIFSGDSRTEPSGLLTWLWRWLLFRVIFGAGLIKLRGDACWRDLSCLDFYFETQPIPNAASWYFHWLPSSVHRAGVVINHVVELAIPLALFAPQPFAAAAALVAMLFQLALIVSGNLSWLNWLTIIVAMPVLHDGWLTWLPGSDQPLSGRFRAPSRTQARAITALALLVAVLSIAPVFNLLSSRQMMNTSFGPFHLVNAYGAFGSITRQRREISIEGTDDEALSDRTVWKEYEFRGKPGDPRRRPPQIAPYHLRIDWLMWFAAMGPPEESLWFGPLIGKLLEGDPQVLGLLKTNPFPDRPPRFIRARLFVYRFSTPDERRRTGQWWTREPLGTYWPPTAGANSSLSR
jgi:hypothetical protein